LTNLKAWLANSDEINTPRARRIRSLVDEAERAGVCGDATRACELEELAGRLLDDDMALRRSLRTALFDLSAAIRTARDAKPMDCDCPSPAQAYSAHPELQPLLDEINRLQRQVDELFGRVHRDDGRIGR
jgi:hypothetical protein